MDEYSNPFLSAAHIHTQTQTKAIKRKEKFFYAYKEKFFDRICIVSDVGFVCSCKNYAKAINWLMCVVVVDYYYGKYCLILFEKQRKKEIGYVWDKIFISL